MKSFELNKKMKEAWALYKSNFVVFFLWYACFFFIKALSDKGPILSIVSAILWILASYIIVKFILDTLGGEKFDIFSKSFLPSVKELWNFFKTLIAFYIISFGLLAAVVVPMLIFKPSAFMISNSFGVYLAITLFAVFAWMIFFSVRFGFACFSSIDKNIGAIKSLKNSWKITKGKFWSVLYFYFLIGCFLVLVSFIAGLIAMLFRSNISGFITETILLMLIYPISIILVIMLYRNLSHLHHHENSNELKDDIKAVEEAVAESTERVVKESEIINE